MCHLAGDPDCWYFWGRAGLRSEDVLRVLPKLRNRFQQPNLNSFKIVHAGSSGKMPETPQLVAIPLLKIVAATDGEKGDNMPILHEAPIESIMAAPREGCPNPTATYSLRVRGNSMNPLIYADYILVVDSSQTNRAQLNGKIVIAWHKDVGLTVSRFQRYDHTEVLHPENRAYASITMDRKNNSKIRARRKLPARYNIRVQKKAGLRSCGCGFSNAYEILDLFEQNIDLIRLGNHRANTDGMGSPI